MRKQVVQKTTQYGLVLALVLGVWGFRAWAQADAAESATEAVKPAIATPTSVDVEQAAARSATLKGADKISLGMVGYDPEGKRGWLHTVRRGETLWHITDAYFGTPWIWPSVWRDNSASIVNPHRINPGDTLWITANQIRPVTAAEAEALLAGKPAGAKGQGGAQGYALPEDKIVDDVVHFSAAENVDLIVKDGIDAAATIVGTQSLMLSLAEGDTIIIGRGKDRVNVGDQLTIYRRSEVVHYPGSSRIFGYLMDVLGWAEVTAVYEETAEAKIQSSRSEIFIGNVLMPREKPVKEIKLTAPTQHLTGQIVAMQDRRLNAMIDDVVYLDKGEAAGLQVGVTLEVVRPLQLMPDTGTDETIPRKTPDVVVGTMVVVATRPESAVALIRTSEHQFVVGESWRTVGMH